MITSSLNRHHEEFTFYWTYTYGVKIMEESTDELGYTGNFLSYDEIFDLMMLTLLLGDHYGVNLGWVPMLSIISIDEKPRYCLAAWVNPIKHGVFNLHELTLSNAGFAIDENMVDDVIKALKETKYRIIHQNCDPKTMQMLGNLWLFPVNSREDFKKLQEAVETVLEDIQAGIYAREIVNTDKSYLQLAG